MDEPSAPSHKSQLGRILQKAASISGRHTGDGIRVGVLHSLYVDATMGQVGEGVDHQPSTEVWQGPGFHRAYAPHNEGPDPYQQACLVSGQGHRPLVVQLE